jgi:oxygen-independent coproporphyrinogen-3 oxidase
MSKIVFDRELVVRHDTTGPRYTSYPTAVQFHAGFDADEYRAECARSVAADPAKPLSLYLHIPFCSTLCFYCACNKIITRNKAKGEKYLEYLAREVRMQGALFPRQRSVVQLHLGGGSPTFLSADQIRSLMRMLGRAFRLATGAERDFSIEVDPRTVDEDGIAELATAGFNRMSFGVQDFDPDVQRAVHRIQSREQTVRVLQAARTHGFRSINLDLIYGLPKQTRESFARTLNDVIALRPDRLSLFNYAHLPDRFSPQQRIRAEELPKPEEKLDILQESVLALTEAGYRHIGMDHFALPDDELSRAQDDGTLHRNFQGYTTKGGCDLVGLGVTAIGTVGNCYAQNYHTLTDYYRKLDDGELPVARGLLMNDDDRLRRDIIMTLMCYSRISVPALEARYGMEFWRSFAAELPVLEQLQKDGLVELRPDAILVTPAGRFLVRNVAMVFDRYLQSAREQARYSRVI